MAGLKSAASVFAVALYVAFLASPAASQTTTKSTGTPTVTRGAPGPVAGVGLAGVLVAGAVTYLIGRAAAKQNGNNPLLVPREPPTLRGNRQRGRPAQHPYDPAVAYTLLGTSFDLELSCGQNSAASCLAVRIRFPDLFMKVHPKLLETGWLCREHTYHRASGGNSILMTSRSSSTLWHHARP